jgi:hypothetical protein
MVAREKLPFSEIIVKNIVDFLDGNAKLKV